MKLTLLHNPKCSKSREALSLIQQWFEDASQYEIREYLKDPLSREEYRDLLEKLNLSALKIIRFKEKLIAENNLTIDSDFAALHALEAYPLLMERPIIYTKDKAIIGRPTEVIIPFLEKL